MTVVNTLGQPEEAQAQGETCGRRKALGVTGQLRNGEQEEKNKRKRVSDPVYFICFGRIPNSPATTREVSVRQRHHRRCVKGSGRLA